MGAEFLARIKLILDGQQQAVTGLKSVEDAANKLSSIKIKTTVDKEGVVTGQQILQTFKPLGKEIESASSKMGDFEKALRRVAIVAPTWMVFRFVLQSTLSLISEQVTFLKNLEDAMARIKIVGKGTAEEYESLRNSLIGLAMSYGVVASAATQAAVIFAQQGRTTDEIIRLTRTAMMGSQVLGADIKTTVENLTAAVEGFNIPVDDSIKIVDKWINVEKQFAVTAQNLADAVKVTGATANQMGISIDALLGDVTAVIEVTRKSGSEAGRALQFIYARLLTTGRDVLAQIAKVPINLDAQKKSTFELTNTYRSATDVLDDLASKWDELTNKERLSIAQTVASKRQMTVFMALMQNYNASIEARIASLDSAGKAEQAFGIIQDTLTFKLNQLTSSWNNLATSIGDTTVFKTAIDGSITLVNVLSTLINKYQTLRNVAVQEKADIDKSTEEYTSQREALMDLIKMRDEYLTRIPTEKNTEILKKIEGALKNVISVGKIGIDINAKDALENLQKQISESRETAIKAKINWDIGTERNELQAKIKELQNIEFTGNPLKNAFTLLNIIKSRSTVKDMQEQLNNLEEKRSKLLSEQLTKYRAEKTLTDAKQAALAAEYGTEEELTDKELEKIRNSERLNLIKETQLLTSRQLLELELEMVKNSIYSLDPHEKMVKQMELESQLRQADLQDMKKVINNELELARIRGVSGKTLVDTEMHLNSLLYGENAVNNSLEYQLQIEKSITQERINQLNISNDNKKIYEILQRYGRGTARAVGEILTGQRTVPEFGGNLEDVLRKFFPEVMEASKMNKVLTREGLLKEQIAAESTQAKFGRFNATNQIDIGGIKITVQPNIPEEDKKELIKNILDVTNKNLRNKLEKELL